MTSVKQELVFIFFAIYVVDYSISIVPGKHIDYTQITPKYFQWPSQIVNPQISQPTCYNIVNNKWGTCPPANPISIMNLTPNKGFVYNAHPRPVQSSPVYSQFINSDGSYTLTTDQPTIQNSMRRKFLPQAADSLNILPIHINIPVKTSGLSKYSEASANEDIISSKNLISAFDNGYTHYPDIISYKSPMTRAYTEQTKSFGLSAMSPTLQKTNSTENDLIRGLDLLERKFYAVTYYKLMGISPVNRKENGISFVQSGLFLLLSLIALSSEVDFISRQEIEKCTGIQFTGSNKLLEVINKILASLPTSTNNLKFRWSTRLVLWPSYTVSEKFKTGPARALQMHIDIFNGTETPDKIAEVLNNMVEIDSGGSIRNTFEEDDLSDGARAILLTTLYLRGRWRSAPTLLNGTRLFRDTEDSSSRLLRYIRINDVMRYADLDEWDAEAIEIFYATPGLSLLIIVPRRSSLRRLADHVANTSIHYITQRMHSIRIAVTMPLYTLRMTLLLPNKLQAMGISRLVDINNTTDTSLRLSHAVQRLMFWADAGRNAFKDDGIEWDKSPELELVVDRPYIFFVRWWNLTLMSGNFVL